MNTQSMNKGKSILEQQNLDTNIDKLLAQRKLYLNAKTLNIILLLVTVLVPVIISIITNWIFNINDKHWIYIYYTVIAFVGEKIAEKLIDKWKKKAAAIQEKFDTEVYQLPENRLLNMVFVGSNEIREYSKKAKENQEKLEKVKNWYSIKIARIKTNVAILFCQRINIIYDQDIREKYKNYLICISIITSLLLVIPLFLNNFKIVKIFSEVLLPLIPLINYIWREINTNSESIDNLQNLREIIKDKLESININDEIDIVLLRKIQDGVYQNRVLSPLIPDCIYKYLWSKLEDTMNYSVESKIDKMLSSTDSSSPNQKRTPP